MGRMGLSGSELTEPNCDGEGICRAVSDFNDEVGLVLGGETDLSNLCRTVEENYPIVVGEFHSLGGELDTNVWVKDKDGHEYTIKRSFCTDPTEIRWQYPVLDHLKSRLYQIHVPSLVQTIDSTSDIVEPYGEGWTVIRLAHWVPGEVIAAVPQASPKLLRGWGHLAADTVLALSDYDISTVPRTHYWDVRNSIDAIESSLDYVHDSEKRQSVEQLLQGSREAILAFSALPQQVVHQDLNDFNVIVDGLSGDPRISGLLDIGDTIVAPRLAELTVAGAYSMLRQTNPFAALEAVIEGYADVIPVTDEEHQIVQKLAALRLCVNATTWTKRFAIDGAEYGQRRMAATWPTIFALAGTSI